MAKKNLNPFAKKDTEVKNNPEIKDVNEEKKEVSEQKIETKSENKVEPVVNQIKKNKKTPKDLVINPKSGDRLKRIRKFR